ncbi:MAG: AAA family ATPase [Chloroflexi bacterium]|nr:AAA family ATPase [Chloroflexota bacterium]
MRITKISVKGLFGMFDHEIPLNQESRITIVHGPNGVGKTVLMRMVHGLFNCDYSYVAFGIPFEQIEIGFENSMFITVEPVELASGTISHPNFGELKQGLRICLSDVTSARSDFTLPVPGTYWEWRKGELLSHLEVKGVSVWGLFQRLETGDDTLWMSENWLFTSEELFDAIPELHDVAFGEAPEWFASIRQEANISLIQTNRVGALNTHGWIDFGRGYEHSEESGLGLGSAVSAISKNIMAIPRGEPIVRNQDRIKAVVATAGLRVDIETEDNDLEHYIETRDWREDFARHIAQRRSYYDTMLNEKVLYEEIINERFLFKAFEIDAEVGLRFVSVSGGPIECENLSSGEQQLLVLYYQLLFETQPDTLVMIDEPELSMNVVWQRNFLKDLQRIIELRKFDVLIATHSPMIIHDKWDWMVPLGEKVDD